MYIQKLSDYFGIKQDNFESKGIFNRFVGRDVKLYVDPFLFENLDIPEFKNARKKIKDHFLKIIKLLLFNNARAKKEATKLLTFKETRGVGLGYGKETDNGKCIGKKLSEKLVQSGKDIIDMGISDPEIFELIGLFEDDFGPDRLSDVAISILKDNFIDYTSRLTKELKIKKNSPYNGGNKKLPYIQELNEQILFMPKSILRELPIAYDRESIIYAAEKNNELRKRLNGLIGSYWKNKLKEINKKQIKNMINEENMKNIVGFYKNHAKDYYNLLEDPKGKISWYDDAIKIITECPLKIINVGNLDENLETIVLQIINQVRDAIEYKGWSKLLYYKSHVHDEKYFQGLFLIIAQSYCKANNLDVSAEPNAGNGPVDFKFSRGTNKITVEIKKDTNDLVHGIETQLPIYEKSEGAQKSFYVVFQVTKEGKQITKLNEFKEKMEKEGKPIPEYFIIDSRLKKSASKRQKE